MSELANITPLIVDYNSKHPLPPEFQPAPLERESRDSLLTPPIEAEALQRTHFRTKRPQPLPAAPAAAPPSPAASHSDAKLPAITEIPTAPPGLLAPWELLKTGVSVEVFFPVAAAKFGGGRDVWLPAMVCKTRVLPGRAGGKERRFVVVNFRGDGRREVSFEHSSPECAPIRLVPNSAMAAPVSTPEPVVWACCDHGVTLLQGGTPQTPYPGCSRVRCRRESCCQSRLKWFSAFSLTSAWDSERSRGTGPFVFSIF